MKNLIFFVIFLMIFTACLAAHPEDVQREQALKQLDSEVDGASNTEDAVPPLSGEQLDEDRSIPSDDPAWDSWGDPFAPPADEYDVRFSEDEED